MDNLLSESLENLQSEFAAWRSSGRPGLRVPDSLKLRAVEELSTHKSGEIQKALSITSPIGPMSVKSIIEARKVVVLITSLF